MNTFAERLLEVMILDGIKDNQARVGKIIDVTGVSRSTARRWLAGTCSPASITTMLSVARGLQVDIKWLIDGSGHSPNDYRCLEFGRSLTPWERNKFKRYCIRLQNNDRKAERLKMLLNKGAISSHQFLSMM